MKKVSGGFKKSFFGIILPLLLIFISCNKDDDAVNITDNTNNNPTEEATVFAMEIDCIGSGVNKKISIYFTTTDSLSIPIVEVNGVLMDVSFNDAMCGFIEIPYSDIVNYKVTANGNSTLGEIPMPNRIDNATCNGVTCMNGVVSVIENTNTFNLSWQPIECDYQSIVYDEGEKNSVLDRNTSTYSILSDDLIHFVNTIYFTLSIYNGDRVNEGSLPSVTGDYGNGFVYSKSGSDFAFNLSSKKSEIILTDSKPNHKVRLKEFVKDFNEVCNNK